MKKFRAAMAIVLAIATLAVFTSGILVACKGPEKEIDVTSQPPLSFNEEGRFRILHLSDFHEWMGIERSGINVEKQSSLKPLLESYLKEVLTQYEPDLVVLGGDNVFSLKLIYDIGDNGISMLTYRTIAEIMEERNQYWTCTFGNHDSESYHPKADFQAALMEYPHFIGGNGETNRLANAANFPSGGKINDCAADDFIGNYSIPIYSAKGEILYNVYVLDSGSYRSPPPSGTPYLSITEAQTNWYASEADKLIEANGAPVPSLLFTHIPFIEVGEAYAAGGLLAGTYAGISPSDKRSPILAECMKRGDMQAIFFGHNHENSATLVYEKDGKKILMGVTPSCQADGYDDVESVMSGRVIDLNSDGSLTTYVISNKDTSEEKVEFPTIG